MAYVKLPSHLRRRRALGPLGRSTTLTFSVFAGETAESRHDDKGRTLILQSSRRRQAFAFDSLPIDTRTGDIAGVAAIMAPGRRTGPIIAVANVERNEKADFIGREKELLRLFSGQRRDYRRRSSALRRAGAGAVGGAALGVGAFLALSAVPLFVAGPAPLAGAQLAAPVGAAVGAVAMTHGALKGWFFARRLGRQQARLLSEIWRGASDCLSFVQSHADAFRAPLGESIRSKNLLEAPRMRPSRRRARKTAGPALDPIFDPAPERVQPSEPLALRTTAPRRQSAGRGRRAALGDAIAGPHVAEPGFSAS